MGGLGKIADLDKLSAWSFFGFVLAVLLGSLTIYMEFLRDNNPRLDFEVISNAPVISVKQRLDGLDVMYRGQEILKSGKTLSVLLVKVVNQGGSKIVTSDYDPSYPVGVTTNSGILIKTDVFGASSKYLTDAVKIKNSPSSIHILPVIIEPQEYFLLRILVLHDAAKPPVIRANGKVAGMLGEPQVRQVQLKKEQNFLQEAFGGNFLVQATRAMSYAFFVFLIVFVFSLFADKMGSIRRRGQRKRIVDEYKAKKENKIPYGFDFIFDLYINGGFFQIMEMVEMLHDHERLASFFAIKRHERRNRPEVAGYVGDFGGVVASLEENGFLVGKEGGEFQVDSDRAEYLLKFSQYIRAQNNVVYLH